MGFAAFGLVVCCLLVLLLTCGCWFLFDLANLLTLIFVGGMGFVVVALALVFYWWTWVCLLVLFGLSWLLIWVWLLI